MVRAFAKCGQRPRTRIPGGCYVCFQVAVLISQGPLQALCGMSGDGTWRTAGIQGNTMIHRQDAPRGRAAFAAQLDQAHGEDVISFCRRVKAAIPSAKPCRLGRPAPPEGMRDPHVRTQARGGPAREGLGPALRLGRVPGPGSCHHREAAVGLIRAEVRPTSDSVRPTCARVRLPCAYCAA